VSRDGRNPLLLLLSKSWEDTSDSWRIARSSRQSIGGRERCNMAKFVVVKVRGEVFGPV